MILAGDRSQSNPSRPGGARAGSPANVHCEVQARVLAAYEASSWPLQSCTNAHALPEGYRFWAHATYRDYEPSPAQWVRDQVELYESSGGTEGTTLRGMPVVVITSRGAKSGTLRKNPVMRVEHDGLHQDVGRGAFAVAGVAAAVVVGAGAGAGGEAAERPGPAGSNEAAVPTPPQHLPPFAR